MQQRAISHQDGLLVEERRRYLPYGAEQPISLITLGQVARDTLIVARTLCLPDGRGELITRAEIMSEAHR